MVLFKRLYSDVFLLLCVLFECYRIGIGQQIFQQCLKSMPSAGLMGCAGRQALTSLSAIQETNNFTIDPGFVMIRDESLAAREMPSFLEQDPMDFRGMLENAGAIVGQRTLQWDLAMIQPGLCLRIGPSAESASMLEFIMDPNHDRGDRFISEEPSTARILAKQFLIPFLLGIKFNLLTVLPLFFAGIILLCKKAAFLGKIALFVSGLLGYGSAFSLGGLAGLGGGWGGGGGGGGYYPGGGGFYGGGVVRPPLLNDVNVNVNQDHLGGYYKDDTWRKEKQLSFTVQPHLALQSADDHFADTFYEFEKKHLLQDRHRGGSKVFEKDKTETEDMSPAGYRTFVWKTN